MSPQSTNTSRRAISSCQDLHTSVQRLPECLLQAQASMWVLSTNSYRWLLLQAVTSTWSFNLQSLMECPLQVRTSTRVLNLLMLLEGLPHARLSGWALLTISLAVTTDLTHNSQGLHTSDLQSCPSFGTLKSKACPWVWMDVEGRKRMVAFYLVLSWLCAILASLAKPSFNLQYKSFKLGVR